MTTADFVLLAIAGITLLGALLAVALRNVFYNALALILCLFGVAGLFIYLQSEFLAIIEVTVYIGAIAVAIIFAIMLSRPMFQKTEPQRTGVIIRSIIASGFIFFSIFSVVSSARWPVNTLEGDYSLKNIGKVLLTSQALPFEVISLILLIAIIGALVISQSKDTTT